MQANPAGNVSRSVQAPPTCPHLHLRTMDMQAGQTPPLVSFGLLMHQPAYAHASASMCSCISEHMLMFQPAYTRASASICLCISQHMPVYQPVHARASASVLFVQGLAHGSRSSLCAKANMQGQD